MSRILYAVIFLWVLTSCNGDNDKIYPVKRAITESVYASVTIQPDSLYKVYAVVNGILDQNLVEEGEIVEKGTPILQIINTSPRLNTENARLALNLAKENYEGRAAILGNIEDEIAAAKLKRDNDSINFRRQEKLWEQKIGSRAEYDTRKLAYQLSSNALELLKNKYSQTEKDLATRLRQAENNYKSSLVNTSDFSIESKIDGKVYALYKNKGEIVSPLQPLASIGEADDFVIELLVDEVDIVKISTGQKVILSLDAYPDKVFTASVNKIYPQKDERNQTFKVEALFKENPPTLYPGLSGEANILIAEKEEALVIPRAYLLDGNKVRTENGIKEIATGLMSLDTIEILSGINEETAIYKPEG